MTIPTSIAIDTATGTVDALRAACQSIETAVDRADAQLRGVDHPLPRAGLSRWDDALTDSWQALGLVYAGISEARQLSGASPANVADVLDGLRAARAEADRAAIEAARLRRQLATAEDRLRHAEADPRAWAAADRWRTAVARLDLAEARLAVGARAIDRYAEALAGIAPPARPVPSGAGVPRSTGAAVEITAGAKTTGAVLLVIHPWEGWRGYLARARREKQLERERNQLW